VGGLLIWEGEIEKRTGEEFNATGAINTEKRGVGGESVPGHKKKKGGSKGRER